MSQTHTITGSFQTADFIDNSSDLLAKVTVEFRGRVVQAGWDSEGEAEVSQIWIRSVQKLVQTRVVRGEITTTERECVDRDEEVRVIRLLEAKRVSCKGWDRHLDELALEALQACFVELGTVEAW